MNTPSGFSFFTSSSVRRWAGALTACVSAALALPASAEPPADRLDGSHANIRAVMAAQKEATPGFMKKPEVLGTAVGVDAEKPVLIVFVDRDSSNAGQVIRDLPKDVRGVGVQVHLTDKFVAEPGKPSGTKTVSHTAVQVPPIQLGTSGGWKADQSNGYCCGGTLGSLISIGGTPHILSNYHVLEADIVPGANNIVAQTGDAIIQPALIDLNCNPAPASTVATLVKKAALPSSNLDAAIAVVTPGMVVADGSILGIGPLSARTLPAALRQGVKKAGRTTGMTRSSISGLNATINVTYENECAGGVAFTKTFTGQIVITNRDSKFLDSGDSGSLLVEDVATRPRAVGLLFAGSSTSAIANPIDEVLSYFGATMVGK